MRVLKKIIIFCIAVAAGIVIAVQLYNLVHYRLYDGYKEFVTSYEVRPGQAFKPLPDSSPDVLGMTLVTENDTLKLYTNTNTAEIAVYDKRTDIITYSNPQYADDDAIASKINKSLLKSQFVLEYFDTKRLAGSYNSYDYSVSNGQFTAESINNGIRYTYTLGDLSSATGIVPIYITKERLDSFAKNLDETEAKYITLRYRESTAAVGFYELNEASRTGQATLRKLNQYFENAGYTADDYEADMLASGVEGAVPISFVVAVEYRLDNDGLVVNVPVKLMQETGGASINRLQVLRYFGAAGTDENGYIVVPNGSGSVINFNNGKTNVEDYSQYIYGIDPMYMDYTVLENTENARLPVFGMQKEDYGIFAEIEKGDSLAALTASVSGKLNSYNYVYPTFLLRTSMPLAMFGTTGNEADLPILEKDMYDTDIQIRYSFLTSDYDGYSGMANYYRESLIKRGMLTAKAEKDEIPFYMDIIGGVKSTEFFIGIRYMDVIPMTTYAQAEKIFDELNALGIKNQVVNYTGWFNGGYYHDVADKIKLVRDLGSKKELEQLAQKIEGSGGKLYGDVAFQQVSFIAEGKRFNYQMESSRYYGGGFVGAFGVVNPATLTATSTMGYLELAYDLLSPKFLPRYAASFAKNIQKYDITGISLRDLGDVLHSDKKRTEYIDREKAKDIVVSQLDVLNNTNKEIMVSGGNAYAFPYADDLVNIPMSDNTFFVIDDEIPFYQMVVHGYMDYSGGIINLSDTYKRSDIIAKLIEYGASPRFAFSYQNASDMKYSGLNRYYSSTFYSWKNDASDIYNKVNEVLKNVANSAMVKHEIIEKGVSRTTYDNGWKIVVNTTDKAVTIDGETINANSYQAGRSAL